MRSYLIGVGRGSPNRWRSLTNGMMRGAPPCGGTEPARRESEGECRMAGDLVGVREPPSQKLAISRIQGEACLIVFDLQIGNLLEVAEIPRDHSIVVH